MNWKYPFPSTICQSPGKGTSGHLLDAAVSLISIGFYPVNIDYDIDPFIDQAIAPL